MYSADLYNLFVIKTGSWINRVGVSITQPISRITSKNQVVLITCQSQMSSSEAMGPRGSSADSKVTGSRGA